MRGLHLSESEESEPESELSDSEPLDSNSEPSDSSDSNSSNSYLSYSDLELSDSNSGLSDSDSEQPRRRPAVELASVNLDALLERALAEGPTENGEGAMWVLRLLSREPSRRAALFAHPQLMQLALDLASRGQEDALFLIAELAQDKSLVREMYLHPGLVEILVCLFEAPSTSLEMIMTARSVLSNLVRHKDNTIGFIRDGYAQRLGDVVGSSSTGDIAQEMGCKVLRDCVEGRRKSMMEEFFRVPGLMGSIVRSEAGRVHVMDILATMATMTMFDLAGEMLNVPGLVDSVLNVVVFNVVEGVRRPPLGGGSFLCAAIVLRQLLLRAPLRALEHPSLMPTLAHTAELEDGGDVPVGRATAYLLGWQLQLTVHKVQLSDMSDWQYAVDKYAVAAFWRNVPGVWAVISRPRVKQRSALRRLPIEMFRLLKDTLGGTLAFERAPRA